MKFRYQFVNEAVDMEIDEKWGAILLDLDRREYNNHQTETRRHASLHAMDYEGEVFVDPAADVVVAIEKALSSKNLQNAVSLLLPQQQILVQKTYFKGRSIAAIAREEGVGESAIRDRLKRIIEKLKKVLD